MTDMHDAIPHESITSPTNPRVRQAAALRSADARRETGLTLVDGRREVALAVAAGVPLVELFVSADRLAENASDASRSATPVAAWLREIATSDTRITMLGQRAFERVAFGSRDEGVVGVARFRPQSLDAASLTAARPVLIVEAVEKPGNLGAILRTADAAGLAGVVVCDGRTDTANPAVIRASLGTVFTVPLAVATVAETLAWLRAAGRAVVAATPQGTRLWHETRLAGRTAILLGSEAHGISAAWQEAAATGAIALDSVRLPMLGRADSLNLSVTAAVLAYESLRQEGLS